MSTKARRERQRKAAVEKEIALLDAIIQKDEEIEMLKEEIKQLKHTLERVQK